jgi:tetratricopeptide (TPR) repeat protein
VLLLVNVVLFAGLGVFAYWVRTGQLFAPTSDDYWAVFRRTFQPAGENRITLSDLLTFPISIYEVPLQIVVLGLLLAALVSIPILVSILYRFPCCIPFLLVVAFLAMMPWLAITLAGSCLLASVRPFRFSFRYASALLGLSLVVIYFYSASRRPASAVQVLSSPSDQIKFVAPWVLAIIASCVVCALVLLIARAVNYRPGALTPLLVAMFAVPVLLFEFRVGRDELHYRLLEHEYGPASPYFAERDLSKEYERALARLYRAHEDPKPPREAIEAQLDLKWQIELSDVLEEHRTAFARHRDAAVEACDGFLYQFPTSRYAANALYIKATALDTRVDLSAFRTEKVIRFYNTFPADASRHTWEKVRSLDLEADPSSPLIAVALLRLAQLDARRRDVARAIEGLGTLLRDFGSAASPATQPSGAISTTFGRKPPASSLMVHLESVVFEAGRWLSLFRSNGLPPGGDPIYRFDPLCGPEKRGSGDPPFGFLQLDPRNEHYARNLRTLIARYPDCLLADNIELEIALSERNLDSRERLLDACAARKPAGDALPEALFRLGETLQQADRPADARTAFRRILTDFPGSVWKQEAETRIRLLPVAPEGAAP